MVPPVSSSSHPKRPVSPVHDEEAKKGPASTASAARVGLQLLSPRTQTARTLKRMTLLQPSPASTSETGTLPAMPLPLTLKSLLSPSLTLGLGSPYSAQPIEPDSPKYKIDSDDEKDYSLPLPSSKAPPSAPVRRRSRIPSTPTHLGPKALFAAPLFVEDPFAAEPNDSQFEAFESSFIRNEQELLSSGQVPLSDGSMGSVELFASGGFSYIYRLGEGQAPLIAGQNNSNVLLRVFRSDKFLNPRAKYVALQEIVKNHAEMQVAGIGTLPFLNQATVFQDGYIAVPFVGDRLKLTEATLPPVRQLLADCYALSINADAHHGTSGRNYEDTNFGMVNGQPVLWDWMHQDEEAGAASCFGTQIPAVLRSFAQGNERSPLIDRLDPRIVDIAWNADTPAAALSEQPLRALRQRKSELAQELLRGEKTVEAAHQAFAQSRQALETQTGLTCLSLHLLDELRSRSQVTKCRKEGVVKPITSMEEVANGNAAILNFLTAPR